MKLNRKKRLASFLLIFGMIYLLLQYSVGSIQLFHNWYYSILFLIVSFTVVTLKTASYSSDEDKSVILLWMFNWVIIKFNDGKYLNFKFDRFDNFWTLIIGRVLVGSNAVEISKMLAKSEKK